MTKEIDIPQVFESEMGYWTPAAFRNLIRGAIREISFRWPTRQQYMQTQRVELPKTFKNGKVGVEVFYRCEVCATLGKTAKNKSGHPVVRVDHKDAVVPVDGRPIDWNEYIHRMFCHPDNFQVICEPCHATKSKAENAERKENAKLERWKRP